MLIAFIIHKFLKLACGPQFSKPPGRSQLRLLCVGLARGPPVALSQDQTLSKGLLSLEMKTKGSQLCDLPAALRGWLFLSSVWKCLATSFVSPGPSASCCGHSLVFPCVLQGPEPWGFPRGSRCLSLLSGLSSDVGNCPACVPPKCSVSVLPSEQGAQA